MAFGSSNKLDITARTLGIGNLFFPHVASFSSTLWPSTVGESKEPEVKMQSLTILCPGRPDLILPFNFVTILKGFSSPSRKEISTASNLASPSPTILSWASNTLTLCGRPV
ncbi:hypothetical protein CFP56_043929 [Quercus suber]|uniref:Uncharacterized protein n=1 Tax=Quercus suber TaxID=58331 RepID=A0AAW0IQH8_QUESU